MILDKKRVFLHKKEQIIINNYKKDLTNIYMYDILIIVREKKKELAKGQAKGFYMIKLRATKKEMREHYWYILSIGYCEMQSLLKEQRAFAYSAGYLGWSCDYYEVGDVLISTGYSPLNNKNMIDDYEVIKEYEKKSLALDGLGLHFEERKNKREELLKEMITTLKIPLKY